MEKAKSESKVLINQASVGITQIDEAQGKNLIYNLVNYFLARVCETSKPHFFSHDFSLIFPISINSIILILVVHNLMILCKFLDFIFFQSCYS